MMARGACGGQWWWWWFEMVVVVVARAAPRHFYPGGSKAGFLIIANYNEIYNI